MDAVGLGRLNDLLLRQGGVVLDLVDGGDNLGSGEELIQVLLAVL